MDNPRLIDNKITIRQATLTDIPEIVRLRRMMFESMGFNNLTRLQASDAASETYFARSIPNGTFYGWLAVTSNGMAVSSGGVVIGHHPPGPNNLPGKIGYIMNIVTEPNYRRRGLARQMMDTIMQWLAEQGIQLMSLHATEIGQPLYKTLGFVETSEMRLKIE